MEGRYGTIHYLKRVQPDTPMITFPIDEEETTIGRESSCSIRLYYPDISPVHCKLFMNEEKKAFLAVHGSTGAIIDDCHVFPSIQSDSRLTPTIVPLTNNAEFKIRDKHFRFTYPPKEMRVALLATPSHPSNMPRRALRMSMIQSALVFSPRPSPNPQENLRVLQSPFKPFRSPSKLSNPQQDSDDEDDNDEDQEIVLVEGNHPRVFEEDRDLVITEDVLIRPQPHGSNTSKSKNGRDRGRVSAVASQRAVVERPPQPPKTPRNRPVARPSLHRAVLIRSAQRAVIRHEVEKEEREEEEEVAEAIAGDDDDDNFLEDVEEESSPFTEDVEMEVDEEASDSEEDIKEGDEDRGVLGVWRKSLGSMWPFRGSASPEKDIPQDISDEADEDNIAEDSDEGDSEPVPSSSPVLQDDTPLPLDAEERAHSRLSLGGAVRIKKEEPKWRVNDISLPPLETDLETAQEEIKKEQLSNEQREAIRERRRSALLRTPDMFFGGTPGTRKTQLSLPSARLPSPTRSNMATLAKADEDLVFHSTPARRLFKTINTPSPQKKGKEPVPNADDSEELDTRVLLERMKETVEGLKRRKSVASPTKPVPTSPTKKQTEFLVSIEVPRFSLLTRTPARSERLEPMDVDEDMLTTKPETLQPLVDELSDGEEKENQAIPSIYPSFDSVRQQPSTPAMDGLREMFRNPLPTPVTPAFEGLGELLQTPEAYRPTPEAIDTGVVVESMVEDTPVVEEEKEDTSVEEEGQGDTTAEESLLPPKKPASQTKRIIPVDTPSLADDESTPGPSKQASDSEEEETAPQVKPKARLLRGRKATTPIASSSVEPEEIPAPEAQTTRITKPVVKGKARAEPVKEEPVTRTTRRLRTTTASSQETKPAAPAKTPARRTRQTINPTPDTETSAPRTRSARKIVTRTTKVKEEDEEDPLDTIAKKSTAKRAAPSRTKAKVDTIKEEPSALEAEVEDTKPRATRGRAKAAPKESPVHDSPAEEAEEEVAEKENTKKKTAVRGKKITRATATRDVETEPEMPTTTKRVTRARTKTAS